MPPTEKLIVDNFAGIKHAEIELASANIFIGPHATGKSVCAKLLFYFKDFVHRDVEAIRDGFDEAGANEQHISVFLKYFPPAFWGSQAFELKYCYGDQHLTMIRKAGSGSIRLLRSELFRIAREDAAKEHSFLPDYPSADFRDDWMRAWRRYIESLGGGALENENYFVPAGRSAFALMEGANYWLMMNGGDFDPFLPLFGNHIVWIRNRQGSGIAPPARVQRWVSSLIGGEYHLGPPDYVLHVDGRNVALRAASSGQQAVFWLALLLEWKSRGYLQDRVTLFIEEPEAHLFPEAQRTVVHLLANVLNFDELGTANQCVITTHSPYILTAFNNLMYAGRTIARSPAKRQAVEQILNGVTPIDPADVRAYLFSEGQVRPIIDAESQLVNAEFLDSVSEEVALEFDRLLDVAYEGQAA